MENSTLPKPLVTFNQWFILTTVLLSLATGLYFLMAFPLLAGLMGLLFKWNPVLIVARKFLSKPVGSYLQEDIAQLQFNQSIAVACLALALFGFYSGLVVIGYVFAIMVGVASGVALMGFCVGCFIRFQWQQYRYRRAS
ncbi:DUF4395 domain-containing protein [Sutcliffiella horikoshii]|uniref:DUF4395 domain-containing protein n=1 Tax=Sutcliffiella horikoshii TaxID=79883 RepID=A0AA94WTJ8_9BACI|nr:DUF4395 domain-containing protein [Sutcliffiella horikoshii]TYS60840.1 DUF4395 domain-containing protein [Sutcliffiella horikoshii]